MNAFFFLCYAGTLLFVLLATQATRGIASVGPSHSSLATPVHLGNSSWAPFHRLEELFLRPSDAPPELSMGLSPLLCGSTTAMCPHHSPVCCGRQDRFYCIPGGTQCCDAETRERSAFCPPSDTCCAFGGEVTCCGPNTTCTSLSMQGVEQPFCAKDTCAAFTSPDSCLLESPSCGWCCAERRCVSGTLGNGTAQTCAHGDAPLQSRSQRCRSRCQYYGTCALCTANRLDRELPHHAQENDDRDESCSWCLSTTTCVSLRDALNCPNDQVVFDAGSCDIASYNAVSSEDTEILITSCIGYFFGVLLLIGVPAEMYRRSMSADDEDEESHFNSTRSPQRSIRRYGFSMDDPDGDAVSALPSSSMVCALCHVALTIAPMPTEECRLPEGRVLPEEPVASELPADFPAEVPAEPSPETVETTTKCGADLPPVSAPASAEASDAASHFAAMLPCHHLLCASCANETMRDAAWPRPLRVVRSQWRRARRWITRGGPSSGPESHAMPAATALMQVLEDRCPSCGSPVTDVFITDLLHQI